MSDKQTSRRMITETGDIIETPLIEEDTTNDGNKTWISFNIFIMNTTKLIV